MAPVNRQVGVTVTIIVVSSSQTAVFETSKKPWWNIEEAMTVMPIDLSDKLKTFAAYWSPKIVSHFNGHDVMVVKVKDEFFWHWHDDIDDFFLVLDGTMTTETEQGNVTLKPGELYTVPKGIRRRPRASAS